MKNKGKVYLIGAGPGDPGLITIKAVECLKRSDVIVYDYLVDTKLLDYAKPEAEIIYVGKKSGHKELSQEKINNLLIKKAADGNVVARLKGGDPFIFGRGGEEAMELQKNDVPFEIIPGVSSFYAVPEYAGIPPTHRDISSTLAVITGHEDPSKAKSNIPWSGLSQISTLVFLMGIKNLPKIAKRLIKNGKSPDTPAAIITWGTYPCQQTYTGTLNNIAKVSEENNVSPPGIVVIGEVVKLRDSIKWFENRPLFGKKIIVTRTEAQAAEFSAKLSELGAKVIVLPTIEIRPPARWNKLDKALRDISNMDWLIFTSANGVKHFFKRFREKRLNNRSLLNARVAVIGEKTRQCVEEYGLSAYITPMEFRAEGLIEVFKTMDLVGSNILIPRAKEARDILPKTLKRLGANVVVAPVYENIVPKELNSKDTIMTIKQSKPDIITFTSPSTVNNFYSVFSPNDKSFKNTLIASIGPITDEALKLHGMKSDLMPAKYTTDAMVEEILKYYSE